MRVSTHIYGYRPADEKWKKMKAAWDACREAGIPPPEEVLRFFGHSYPGSAVGREVNIDECVKEINEGESFHQEIDLTLLPHGITHIRITQSC